MNTSSDRTGRGEGRTRVTIAALALLTLLAAGTTAYLWSTNTGLSSTLDQDKLHIERLFAEKLQLEKRIVDLNGRLSTTDADLAEAGNEAADLRRRVQEAIAHANGLERDARKGRNLAKEVAELRTLKQDLEAQVNATRSHEQDLQAQLDRMTRERDALAATLEEHRTAAQMVNNAEVDALRGRKGKLTVLARRTRQIRMAFDLPQDMARGTSFLIIAPDGHRYEGADPRISTTIDAVEGEPMASIDLMPMGAAGERAARVHLAFTPTEKLKPGTYRIDVMTGGAYVNTVLLNLR